MSNIIRKIGYKLGIIGSMTISPSEIFQNNGNGTFTIKRPISVGGNFMSNVVFSSGVKVGKLDLTALATKRLLVVQERNGVYIITGYYE